MRVHVEMTTTEPGGAALPRLLRFGDREVGVADICDRWRGAAYCYYKLISEDGDTYILRVETPHDAWSLVFYRAAGMADCADVAARHTGAYM